jgi:hypothetical protein
MAGRRQAAFLRASRPVLFRKALDFALDFALDIIVPSRHPLTVGVLYHAGFSRAKRGFMSLESTMRRVL